MAQYDGSIRIGTEITTKQAEKELKSLESSIFETAGKISSLRSKMDALKDVKLPTQEYKEIQSQIENTEKKINDLLARQEKFLATGGNESSSAYKKMQYDIDELKSSLPYLKGELQELIDTGKAFTLGSDTEKYAQMSAQMQQLNQQMQSDTQRQSELQSALSTEEQRLAGIKANATISDQEIISLLERRKQLMSDIKDMEAAGVGLGFKQYEDANRELEEINTKVKNYKNNLSQVPEKFEKMNKSAKKAFNAVASGTKKSSGLLSTFSSRLKGIALSLLIFNWISKGFNALISGMKKGFENLSGYSDSYAQSVQNMKNAMSTLGNQFAAAFAPIVQMVIPWLTSLVSALSTAITYVTQFIAVLSGKSTFIRAKKVQDDYNKSLGGTAKAADKARGALAKFDDLDVLQKQEDSSGGGEGGDAVGDMFEEVPVDKNVLFWLDSVLEKLRELKNIFLQGFWDGLGDWEYRWESIKESVGSIKKSLKNIFTDPVVLSAVDEWIKSVAYRLGSFTGSMISIGLTIATNLVGGISKYLEENTDRIKEHLVSMFDIKQEINGLYAEYYQAIAYVFEAFASEQGQQLTANIIGIFASAFMGITELASELIRDILTIFIQPFVENKEAFKIALEGFLGVLSEVTGTIKQGIDDTFAKLKEIYDKHFKPFFDSIAKGLSDTVGKFMDFWNNNVQPILEEWADGFDQLWKEHIQPMLDNFIGLLGKVADFLRAVWENVLKPLIDWIIENVLPVILPIIDGIGKAVMTLFGLISDVVSEIINVFGGIIDFLTGVFTGDWDKAWNGIIEVFKGIFNLIPTIIEGIINSAINIINGLIGGINKITGVVGIPQIPQIPTVELPRLATGAVIRGGNPFMAILGDQPAGQTNIEAPLATIEQAVENVMSRRGYSNERIPVNINLNYDGETFARLSISDILSELGREGYNVDVLGEK